MTDRTGRIYLVGAGPGDPRLLTLRGKECLEQADTIIYDPLVHPALLQFAHRQAECVSTDEILPDQPRSGQHLARVILDRALSGKTVVHLCSSDPFSTPSAVEEAEVLAAAGVAFDTVPGIPWATAVPTYAGIPLVAIDRAPTFTIVDGLSGLNQFDPGQIASAETLVIRTRGDALAELCRQLIAGGQSARTPFAVIRHGTRPLQQALVSYLGAIADQIQIDAVSAEIVVVVGDIVSGRERLRWFDNRPLFGKRVLITRAREQSGTLVALLEERGAIPIELPTIQIEPPTAWTAVDAVIDGLAQYSWAIFTSANGVRWFFDRLEKRGYDLRALKGVRIAAIGPSTAAALAAMHLRVDFVPTEAVAESFVAGMQRFELKDQRVLLPRAQDAREVLVDGLRDQGAFVDDVAVYQTRPAGDPESVRRLFRERQIDVVTFTSSSTVRNLVRLLGDEAQSLAASVRVASIGPITSQTAASLGLTVDVEAAEHTVPGLIAAVEEAFRS